MRHPRPLVAFALVAMCAATAFAGRVDVVVPLGGTVDANVAAPGDSVTIGFLVTQGTGRQLSFQVKRAKGSTLVPAVTIFAPDGTVYDLAAHGGSVSPSATAWKAKLPDVPQTGLWRLVLSGTSQSTGHGTVSIKGKDALKVTGSAAIAIGGTATVPLVAGDGVVLNVTVKRAAGSLVVPALAVLDPSGVPVWDGAPVAGNAKTGALSVKALRLPLFGRYTLRFSGATNAGGGVTYAISTAPAATKGPVPVADAGPAFEAEPTIASRLDGSRSAPTPGAGLTYRWTQVSGPSAQLANPGAVTPTFVAPASATSVAFQLAVSSGGQFSKTSTVAVEVGRRPVADAGRSQSVLSSASVTLDGTGSFDRKGGALKYVWRQIPGSAPAVTLTGANTATPSFSAPPGKFEFRFGLVVDDGSVRSFEDVVIVSTADQQRAVADAGREQYVRPMASVRLSGLGARTGSGVLDAPIAWTQVSGPPVVLGGADTPWPSFIAPVDSADLVFEMNLNGGSGIADRATVHVRTSETNLPPAAKASAPPVAPAGPAALSAATSSDPEADPLRFQWAQTAGPGVVLGGAGSTAATAAIPAGSDQYVFAVQANDGLAYGAPDVVSVRSAGFAGRPIAAAGPNRSADPGVLVTLDGSGSLRTDGVVAPLTYRWTQVGGREWFDVAARVPAFDATAQRPALALPIDVSSLCPTQTLLFQLVVDDGANQSVPDLVSVTFTNVPLNGKPSVTAAASDLNPVPGQLVTLFGTVHDADGDPLTVKWKQLSGPVTTLAPDVTSLTPTFVAPAQGTIVFQITAEDGHWESAPATVSVTVNRRPVASIASSPPSGGLDTFVTFDGSGSSDPENTPLTFIWTQTAGTAVPFTPGAQIVSFNAPASTVTFRLVVSDGRQDSLPATASFSSALAVPTPTSNATGGKAPYGATVSLAANPAAGGPYTYVWRQINPGGANPAVTLSSLTAANPTFSVPLPTTVAFGATPSATFGVIVSDATRTSPEGIVTVNFYASLNATSLTSNTVYAIISSSCTSCHSGTNNTCPVFSGYEYGMGTVTAFLANSRGVTACGSSKTRTPAAGATGQSANSYLLDRLKGIGGTGMPIGSPLSGTQIRLVQDWIDQGSQNN